MLRHRFIGRNNIEHLILFVLIATKGTMLFYAPHFNNIMNGISATELQMQKITSFHTIGIALSVIISGYICGIKGRKIPLVIGLAITSAATMLLFFAKSFLFFAIGELLRGVGIGACWSLCYVILRDIFSDEKLAKSMTFSHMLVALFAIFIPFICALFENWRDVFLLFGAIDLTALLLCHYMLYETKKRKISKISFFDFMARYINLYKNSSFLLFSIVKILAVAIFIVDWASISLVMVSSYGCDKTDIATLLLIAQVAYVLGCITSNKIARYTSRYKILCYGLIMCMIPIIYIVFLGHLNLEPILMQCLRSPFYFGLGFVFGNATYFVLNSVNKDTGIAVSSMMITEMFFASLVNYIVSIFYNGTLYPSAICAMGCTLLSLYILRKKGHRAH